MNIKQTIVVRKDLHMRTGKIAAQSAHCSMKVYFDRMIENGREFYNGVEKQKFSCEFTPEMLEWLSWEEGKSGFTKIVVSCNSEEELMALKAQADEAHIPNAVILDNGVTEFHGVKTYTALAIGPDQAEKIDLITGKLSLM